MDRGWNDVSTWNWKLGAGWNDVSTTDLKTNPVTITGFFNKYEAAYFTAKLQIQGKMLLEL